MRLRSNARPALAFAALLVTAPAWSVAGPLAAQLPPDHAERVDEIFARWDSNTSAGCAVGVAKDGLVVLEEAYGMADLEHGVPNTPETIFEGGSLSKQFTAAAVVLLALDGKLTLDDDVREYVPELPDYGHTITLRHLMTHTSGLRDWGSVASISGWGREQRSHDHGDVLDILSRQTELNFVPGHEYSYSNSGYNLLAIVVDRVSGMPFADFSMERIFEPLGLRDTQWRDDYRRLVPGRSSAYSRTGEGWEINRPIEHVHGNGGILTTVGDLGIWAQALEDGRLGGSDFVRMMHETGRLNDGSDIVYAGGLRVEDYRGVSSVTHTGSTAGYRAFLGRYPEQGLSVAMLCNASNVSTGGNGTAVARVYLGDALVEPVANRAVPSGSVAPVQQLTGLFADPVTGSTMTVEAREDGSITIDDRVMVRTGVLDFAPTTGARRFVFDESLQSFEVEDWQYTQQRYWRVDGSWSPSAAELEEFVGTYHSADAETTYRVSVEDGTLVVWQRPDDERTLEPIYDDAFRMTGGRIVRFRRDAAGDVVALSLSLGRVYDMRFERVVR